MEYGNQDVYELIKRLLGVETGKLIDQEIFEKGNFKDTKYLDTTGLPRKFLIELQDIRRAKRIIINSVKQGKIYSFESLGQEVFTRCKEKGSITKEDLKELLTDEIYPPNYIDVITTFFDMLEERIITRGINATLNKVPASYLIPALAKDRISDPIRPKKNTRPPPTLK